MYEQLFMYCQLMAVLESPSAVLPTQEAPHRGRRDAPCDHAPRPTRPPISGSDAEFLAETFRVLGDPTRVRLLDILHGGEQCVCALAALLGATESAVSHQLRVLRALRLVRARRAGRLMYYALDDDHIHQLFAVGLEHVRERAAGARPAQGV